MGLVNKSTDRRQRTSKLSNNTSIVSMCVMCVEVSKIVKA